MWKLEGAKDSVHGQPQLTSLNDFVGRQVWRFDPDAGTPEQRAEVDKLREVYAANRYAHKHSADELLRLQARATGKDLSSRRSLGVQEDTAVTTPLVEGITRAVSFYETLQMPDGHWPGDYGGPMFLMPGLLITLHVTGSMNSVLTPQHRQEMVRYLTNHQNRDGGYGLHIEGHSTMFGTVLNYVSLRLLGRPADDPVCVKAREWILERGGATYIPSWGKFWLSALGVHSYDGLNPIPPELWLLPYSGWTGIGWVHPGRMWCHCRMVYLPMCVMYGQRSVGPQSPLTEALRQELYPEPYESIPWHLARSRCAKEDLYYPHPWIQDALWAVLYRVDPYLVGTRLRKAAVSECMKLIHYEDENTRYVDIGPVNKVLNTLACWFEEPGGDAFRRHLPRLLDYLWVAEDGCKMQGYNGSQLWDTAFAVQAIYATGMAEKFSSCLKRAHEYIEKSQVQEDCAAPIDRWYRHISKGAWAFSSRDHGWPIADCASEGLKAALELMELGTDVAGPPIPAERLNDCVNVILSFQNPSGGWATYENQRSFAALELLNPAEVFGDIMVDYDYVELSSACITALAAFSKAFPEHRTAEVGKAVQRGVAYCKSIQRRDGSWYGSWGVCFTYGAWFGCSALAAGGETVANSSAQSKAADFLLHKQRADGGWGESYLSSQDCVYSQLPAGEPSHVVNTAWAMLALMAAGQHAVDPKPLARAARYLLQAQLPSGDWPQQTISGVFNKNCMITYANYRNIFPIWALGSFRTKVLLHSQQ